MIRKIWMKSKLKCEMIWKLWKKGKLKCEMLWTIWKKGKTNSEKIWKIWKKNSWIGKWHGKCEKKKGWIAKWDGKYAVKVEKLCDLRYIVRLFIAPFYLLSILRNAYTKSGSLRFSQFSGYWLILSVYILMSFDFPFVRLLGVR